MSKSNRHARIAGAIGASLALLLVACSSDSKGAATSTTAAPAASSDIPVASSDIPVGSSDIPVGSSDIPLSSSDIPVGSSDIPVGSSDIPLGSSDIPATDALTTLGKGEGELNIIAWAGYAEDGSDDPSVDWVTPFEKDTGCKVNVKIGNTSDEMVQLMQTGEYDGVSASGDATTRLIDGGEVSPVNTDLIPNYADVFSQLKLQPWNSKDGVPYGVPHGRGANLLVYNTEAFPTAPDSLAVMFDKTAAGDAAGKLSVYDSPIYIADAAIYLMSTQPDLKITNPYALDQKQFDAAIALLKEQKALTTQYWSLYTDQQTALDSGTVLAGTTWQVIVGLAQTDGAKIAAVKTKEGATGWSDTWMISSKAKHPNCMYMWMNHIISPEANAAVAQWFGEAPSNSKSCALAAAGFCDDYHAADDKYWNDVWYWTTATAKCLDGRTDVKCVPYSEWVNAWTELRA
ncbi:MAG: spermidine/putrescine transporter substrate-binding protein [Ilumatobacteraceae bacterium]|nr:spermidine/putrescine transporter substrate-binding protein [Ilumatobacteraceae bacterium]